MSATRAPSRECDLVMKGGITSGLVYPKAVLDLSQAYRFRNIGGTSAGAIAAAAAAAAELGRDAGGFERLEQMQAQLGQEGFVRDLFQPAPAAEVAFRFALAMLGGGGVARQPVSRRAIAALLRTAPGAAIVGWLIGLGVSLGVIVLPWMHAFWPAWTGAVSATSVLVGIVLIGVCFASALLGAVVASAGKVARSALGSVGANGGFGLCPGSAGSGTSSAANILTDWLAEKLDVLADRSPTGPPLTFADLAGNKTSTGADAAVALRLVTSNLSEGQPYLLPMTRRFVFDEKEFFALFPPRIVDAMIKLSNAEVHKKVKLPPGLHYLPPGDALPVIVGVRMSLSFPVLLCAVRLYTVKASAFAMSASDRPPKELARADLDEHWFSDGGISSNFPIHLFDSWFPTRPTFGITLVETGDRSVPVAFLPQPRDFDDVRPDVAPIPGPVEFLSAIFNTAQNFRDNMQAVMPSYRERIVRVALYPGEGGLNLNMDAKQIAAVQKKGEVAAEAIQKTFDFPQHEWVRALVLLSRLEEEVGHVVRAFGGAPDASGQADLAAVASAAFKGLCDLQLGQPKEGRWYRPRSEAWCAEAQRRVDALVTLMWTWNDMQGRWRQTHKGADGFFTVDDPHPRGILRITPR